MFITLIKLDGNIGPSYSRDKRKKAMDSIILIFPPQFEPFQPYLSLPVLTAILKSRGYSVDVYDFNIDYFNWVFSPNYIEQSLRNFDKKENGRDKFIIERGKYALLHLSEAIQVLKTQKAFVNLPKYKWAMNVLRTALEVVSERFKPSKIDFYEARCGSTNFNSFRIYNAINNSHLNLFEEFIEDFVIPIFQKNAPDFIGFSLVIHDQLAFTLTLCREIRRHFPKIHLCAGGPLVSRLGQEMAVSRHISQFFDSFVIGNGEETICELVDALETGTDPTKIHGVLVPGRQDKFKSRLSENSLSTILPDFSCLPLEKYFSPYLVLPYLTSHGCYWRKCTFCCHRYPYGKYREKPIEIVVNQLAKLSEDYKTKYFSFSDEGIPPKRMRDLALEIINRNLNIKWFTFARMEKAFKEPDFCNLIYHAGCRTLMFGLESAIQRVLDLMEKGTEVANVPKILSACKKASISVRLDAMIGFPTESEEESDYTLKFIRRHRDLIDTPFSIIPLSIFELQRDSPIMKNPGKYGVYPKEPLRGDLDYQFRYDIQNGMDYSKKVKAYKKYISILNSEFNGPSICPENKTHAFIMKCLHDERLISADSFSKIKEKLNGYVPVLYQGIQCRPPNTCNGNVHRYFLFNLLNGMEVEINSLCKKVIDLIKNCYTLKEMLACFEREHGFLSNNFKASFWAFLKFLFQNDFIYFVHSILRQKEDSFFDNQEFLISTKEITSCKKEGYMSREFETGGPNDKSNFGKIS